MIDEALRSDLRAVFNGTACEAVHERVRAYLEAAVPGVVDAILRRGLRYHEPSPALTEAEKECMVLVACGLKNEAIARCRHTTVKTVKQQRSSAYRRLGACNAPHAVALMLLRDES